MTLIEAGLTPDEIAKSIQDEEEMKELEKTEGKTVESFSNEGDIFE